MEKVIHKLISKEQSAFVYLVGTLLIPSWIFTKSHENPKLHGRVLSTLAPKMHQLPPSNLGFSVMKLWKEGLLVD